MRFFVLIPLVLLNFSVFSQKKQQFNELSLNSASSITSKIKKVNPSGFEKIVLENALYDPSKKNLPYYLETLQGSNSDSYTGKLSNQKTLVISGPAAEVIRQNFASFLKADFQVFTEQITVSGRKIWQARVIPFRISEAGQIEELVSYSIQWQQGPQMQSKQASLQSFKNNSVLSSGKWYKMAVTQTGVHKLDASFFITAGIDLSSINPKNIRIYGNGGWQIPEKNSDFRYDDLEENAIEVIGENDNVFNTGDLVLFYAQNTTKWVQTYTSEGVLFSHRKNVYTDTTFYYLNFDLGPGKRISSQNSVATPSNISTNSYDYYNYHELDQVNLVKSGRNFFGEFFDVTTNYSFNFNDGNFLTNDTIRVDAAIGGRGNIDNSYNISSNGASFNILCPGFPTSNYLADYVVVKSGRGKAINSNYNSINVSISRLTPNTVGYLDKFTINARRELTYNGTSFNFRDLRVSAPGNICSFNLNSNGNSGLSIWNVTNFVCTD